MVKEIHIAYSRHCLLPSDIADEYKYKARGFIQEVHEELENLKDNPVESLGVVIEQAIWRETEKLENVYSLTINNVLRIQIKIDEVIQRSPTIVAEKLIQKINDRIQQVIISKTYKTK